MVDIHSHILPGVDDGSQNLETSLAMLRMAEESGTTDIVATPHVIEAHGGLSWDIIRRKVEELQKKADAEGIKIRIHPGAELEMNWDLLELIKAGKNVYGPAESRYLLMEMPSLQLPMHLEDMIYELQLMGRVPILAHPERQPQLMQNPEKLLDLLENGVLTQCNGGSLFGTFGKTVAKNAEMLLENHMICFLGSDAHGTGRRNPDLRRAYEILERKTASEDFKNITAGNAQYILQDKEITADIFAEGLPKKVIRADDVRKKKKGFFQKLFGGF